MTLNFFLCLEGRCNIRSKYFVASAIVAQLQGAITGPFYPVLRQKEHQKGSQKYFWMSTQEFEPSLVVGKLSASSPGGKDF